MAGKHNFMRELKELKGNLVWVFKQSKGFRGYTFGFLGINLLTMVVTLSSTVAGKFVVDTATSADSQNFTLYIAVMLLTTLITILMGFFATLFSSYVGEKFAFSVRARMFDRVQRGRWFNISKFHSANILSRLTGDVNTIASAIISVVPSAIVSFLELVIVAGILLYFDPVMALVGLVVGPLGVIAGTAFRRKYVRYQVKLRDSESEYYSFFQETLANIQITKSFQQEDENNDRFEDIRKERLSLVMKSARLGALMSIMMKLVYNIGYVVAFSWCAYRLSQPDSGYTYGTMTLFLSLVSVLQGTIKSLGAIIPRSLSAVVAAKRLREITDIPADEYKGCTDIPENVGLRFEGVSFTYDDQKILDNINLTVASGQRIGIVGASGAGKTTLIRMLLSLISPDCGKAEFVTDGKKEEISPDSRRFISYVPQGNTLISGTVKSNLLTADKNATEEDMMKALDFAEAGEFVRANPRGLDMTLSEKAGGMSEGQAQRIAIARAILRDRPVLILDEATSALDEACEGRILQRLSELKGKTCFIITHRKSMLRYCDSVAEIDAEGKLTLKNSDNYINHEKML